MRKRSSAHWKKACCRSARRVGLLAVAVAVTGLPLGLTGPVSAKATFITFAAPNAVNTQPAAINQFGDVAGGFSDSTTGEEFGFVRSNFGGSISVIEFVGQKASRVHDINDDLVITGEWEDSNFNHHCFVGVPDHRFHTCDPKDAAQAFGVAINNQTHKGTAVVAGDYSDAQEKEHGFIWEAGVATEFDVTGATSVGAPMDINDAGTIVGTWSDAQHFVHGFLRKHNGDISTFDAPCGDFTTEPEAINSAGAIVGTCADDKGFHSFLINPDGSSLVFDPPGALRSDATGINSKGAITGNWTDQLEIDHGYIRSPGGRLTPVDVSHALATDPTAINDSGAVTGDFQRNRGGFQGFIRTP